MATFPRNIVFLSSLMFLLFISFSYAITGADINAICSQAMNPSFCQSFLSNPKTLNIHLPTLASIIVEIAQASASGTLTQIQSPAQKETNPDLKQVYTTCSENYDNVAGDLNEAKAYLAAGDTPTVNIRVSSAMDGVNTCLQELKNVKNDPSIVKKSKDLENVCGDPCYLKHVATQGMKNLSQYI